MEYIETLISEENEAKLKEELSIINRVIWDISQELVEMLNKNPNWNSEREKEIRKQLEFLQKKKEKIIESKLL